MRVGIVGAGLQANRRLAALAPEDRLVALYSQRDRRAEALIERYGGEAVDNWQDLVARKDLDAVIVASPPRSHREIVVAALEAGKHVLCEKPLAASSEEATVMAEAAARRGRILICGFNHRFHPAITAARELLETGIHGRVLALDAAYGHGLRGGYAEEWRSDPAQVSGGQLMEQGIHLVDLVEYLVSPVDAVVARLGHHFALPGNLEDDARLLLALRSGVTATVHSSLAFWRNRFTFEVTCERATIRVVGLGGSYGVETLVVEPRIDGPCRQEITEFRGSDCSWDREWEYFREATARPQHQESDAGRRALAVVEAAYRSVKHQRWEQVAS